MNEIQWSEDMVKGYTLAHFEQIHLGLRKMVAVDLSSLDHKKAIQFLNECCQRYNCRVCWQDSGEYWIVHRDNPFYRQIPSRWSSDPEDHWIRGQLLGYNDLIIKQYPLIKGGSNGNNLSTK